MQHQVSFSEFRESALAGPIWRLTGYILDPMAGGRQARDGRYMLMNPTSQSASEARRSPPESPARVPLEGPRAEARRPDVVDAYVEDSFPASDPPGWWAGQA